MNKEKSKEKPSLAFELESKEEEQEEAVASTEETDNAGTDPVEPKQDTALVSERPTTDLSVNMTEFKALGLSDEFVRDLMALPKGERREILEALEEDLMGNLANEEPEFPKIDVLHSAAMFEFPDGTKVDTFEGTIIEILPARAWWEKAMSKENLPPDCHSGDWLTPDSDAPNKQARTCAQCSHNVWGTGVDATGEPTRGKACRMRKRVFLHLPGHEIPFLLSVPPKSLRSLRKYLVDDLSDKKIQKNRILTTFGLDPQTEGAQKFSILTFIAGAELSLQEYLAVRKKREAYLSNMTSVKIGTDEFTGDEEGESGVPSAGGDDMPF